MRIVLATPNYLPYVRRGTASYVRLLAGYLAGEGHEVTVLAATPGPPRTRREDGFRVRYLRYLQHPLIAGRVSRYETHALPALAWLLTHRMDVLYCMHHPEAFAAHLAGRVKRLPYVVNLTSVPFERYWGGSRLRRRMFERGLASAAARTCPSAFTQRHLREVYGLEGRVVPVPVDTRRFAPPAGRDGVPRDVLFVSDLDDERKGLDLLLQGFALAYPHLPGVRLVLAGPGDRRRLEGRLRALPGPVRRAVVQAGPGRHGDLPALYGAAAVTVLPSVDEVFGMVLVESLACGTPVVACRSGALPEIVDEPSTGRLFEPGDARGLAEALRAAWTLSRDPAAAARCRRRAMAYDVASVGPRILEVLEAAAGAKARGAAAWGLSGGGSRS